MSDWINQSVPVPPQPIGGSTTTASQDWINTPISKGKGIVDTRKPSGLTLFIDPSKFGAVASGIQGSIPQGPSPMGLYQDPRNGLSIGTSPQDLAIQKQQASDIAAHPNYATAGNVLGTSLMGALGGAEGATLPRLGINMAKSAGLADLSQGGASLGNAIAPGNPLASLAGGLLAPLGAAGVLGGLNQAGNSIMSSIAPKTATSDALQNLGTRFNVPLDLADITQSKGLQNVRTVLEKTPFSGMLDAQDAKQTAIQNAGRNILESTQTPSEFGDPQSQVVASVNKAYQAAQATKRQLYQQARDLAPKNDLVPSTNMQQAAQKAIDTYTSNSDLEGQPSWVPQFQKYAKAKPRSYSDLMKLSDQINAHISPGYPKTAEDLAWMSLDDGLNKDAQAFASSPKYKNSQFAQAQANADQFYKDVIVPFKDRQLGNMGRGITDSDTVLSTWVKPGRENNLNRLMDNMDDQGKKALIQATLQKGFGVDNLQADTSFSAMKFANYWDSLGKTKDALFRDNPDLRDSIDGYVKLVRAVGSPLGNPQTGHQIGNWEALGKLGAIGTAGFLAHGPVGAVAAPMAAIGTGKAFTNLMTSSWGQRLLLTAKNTNDSGLLKRLAVSAWMNLRNVGSNPGSVGAGSPRIPLSVQFPQGQAPQ